MKFYGLIIGLFLATTSMAKLTFNDGYKDIDASFENITLQDALTEIANETKIEITTNSSLNNGINVGYNSITLDKLLETLLVRHNAIFIRDPSTNEVTKVRIFSGKSTFASKEEKKKRKPLSNKTRKSKNGFYMTVRINDSKKTTRLLVDSGASILTISLKEANKMGLFGTGNIKVDTAGGRTNGKKIILDSFEMAGLTLTNVKAIILPNLKERGLIGQNILSQYKQIIDGNKMVFTPLNRTAPPPKPIKQEEEKDKVEGEKLKDEKAPTDKEKSKNGGKPTNKEIPTDNTPKNKDNTDIPPKEPAELKKENKQEAEVKETEKEPVKTLKWLGE